MAIVQRYRFRAQVSHRRSRDFVIAFVGSWIRFSRRWGPRVVCPPPHRWIRMSDPFYLPVEATFNWKPVNLLGPVFEPLLPEPDCLVIACARRCTCVLCDASVKDLTSTWFLPRNGHLLLLFHSDISFNAAKYFSANANLMLRVIMRVWKIESDIYEGFKRLL